MKLSASLVMFIEINMVHSFALLI